MADKAFITPKVLRWARETARISVEIAASKVSVEPEKIIEWEQGRSYPTIHQAEMLAKAYRRPFAIFFLPDVPFDFTPLQDFRKPSSVPLSTASIFIIREIQQKQSWLREIALDNNEEKLPFVGKFSILSNPSDVANDILNTLNIHPAKYQTNNPIREWVLKAEAKGIFISRTSFIHSHLLLNSAELQGFSISDEYCPFIFINSEDWVAPQLFTLVHELAHIWIAETGISNDIETENLLDSEINPVERFCNEVAANALMPASEMDIIESEIYNTFEQVFKTAKKFGISSITLLYRSLNLNKIDKNKFDKLKSIAVREYRTFLKKEEEKKLKAKEKKGGPKYYQLLINKNGALFTQVVLDAWRGGHIEPTQASLLLNTRINNFQKLETFIHK